MKEKAPLQVFDANSEKVRKAEGVIPGATLLTSSSKYDTKVLPGLKETRLVFYCYNTQCTASHRAAETASKAGYKNLYVLSDGIAGWKKAGQKTAQP
jgi:rhodanese-related sulfurtransferase